MADQIDPVLESLLRTTLRVEAASIPFRLRAEDVRPTTTRAATGGWRSLVLGAVAALIVAVVGGVVLVSAFRAPIRVASPPTAPSAGPVGALSALPSFDRLLEMLDFDREVARGEGLSTTPAVTMLRSEPGVPLVELLFACQGPGLRINPPGGLDPIEPGVDCTGGMMRVPVRGVPEADDGLEVVAPAGTAWRAVLIGRSDQAADLPAGTRNVAGLPSFDDLASGFAAGVVVVEGSGTSTGPDQVFMLDVPDTRGRLRLIFACSDGLIQYSLGTVSEVDTGFGFALAAGNSGPVELPRGAPNPAWSVIRIRLAAAGSWTAIVVEEQPPGSSPER